MKRTWLMMIAWSLPVIAWGNIEFGTSIAGAATTSCTDTSFGREQPPLIAGSNSVSTGLCTVPLLGTSSASASASVDPLGVGFGIEGQATTTATSNFVAGLASATATYFDTVHLISPLIDYAGGVSVVAGDTYNLNVSGAGPTHQAGASVTFSILSINGEPVPSPTTYQQAASQTTNGTSTGNLSVDFTVLACPCSFVWEINGAASSVEGSSASFHDPFFIDLPPGWAYTLASQTVVTTPEPATPLLTGIGLLLLVLLGRPDFRLTRPPA
ncbi:MAG TPA: hypothetical protein VG096_18320 [Bryobacteraceae bacterium]|jgi:hypothetical protein|nr:hypothetical protein [Bryobacteraceae bacterium]